MNFCLGWSPINTKFSPNCLQSILSEAQSKSFTFISVPIQVKPCGLLQNFTDLASLKQWQSSLIASSDRTLLASIDWSNRILFKISLNDENLQNLLEYAAHLTVFAVLIDDNDWEVENVLNLLDLHKSQSFPFKIYFKCQFFNWMKWNNLMSSLKDSKIKEALGVVVELGGTLEEATNFHYKIWQCEVLKGFIIQENIFIRNAKGFPVLPRLIQIYLKNLLGIFRELPVILSTEPSVSADCAVYMKWLLDPERLENEPNEIEKRIRGFVEGFENVLQTPLQPLHDHLPSETYEIFERDPVKYQLYEEAIEAALKDISGPLGEVKIGVFGAGRGPLVQCALNAAERLACPVKVVALEKSPNACLTLLDRFKAFPQVEIVFGDMRRVPGGEADNVFDLIVSELLGSFGDNELSPECLWPVESLLKPNGIFIPQSYTSYIEPCYSPILRSQVEELQNILPGDSFNYGYVVHVTKSFKNSLNPCPIFEFVHPKRSNEDDAIKSVKVSFKSESPQVPIDGLIGYFDCKLYGSVQMSTVPMNASLGMLSWFPIYFPLKQPVTGDQIEVEFKRQKDSKRVWYEWRVNEEEFQNYNGDSYSIFI